MKYCHKFVINSFKLNEFVLLFNVHIHTVKRYCPKSIWMFHNHSFIHSIAYSSPTAYISRISENKIKYSSFFWKKKSNSTTICNSMYSIFQWMNVILLVDKNTAYYVIIQFKWSNPNVEMFIHTWKIKQNVRRAAGIIELLFVNKYVDGEMETSA